MSGLGIRRWVFLLVAGALASPSLSVAQSSAKRIEISGFVGGLTVSQSLGNVSTLFVDVSGEAQNVDFGKFYGVRGSFALTDNIAIEGGFAQGENSYTFSADDRDAGSVDLGEQFDADQLFYGVGAVIQFPTSSGLVPYGTAGVGQHRVTPSSTLVDIDELTSTDIYFGAGVKYFFTQNLGARFDLRRHVVSDGFAFAGTSGEPSMTEFTIGVVVGF